MRWRTEGQVRAVRIAVLTLVGAACADRSSSPDASPAEILASRSAGETWLRQDRLPEARAEFERLIGMAPTEAAGYAGLGLVALRDGDLDEAERRLEQARDRSLGDDALEIELALARLRWEARDVTSARERLDRLIARDSSHTRAIWMRALLERDEAGPESELWRDLLRRAVATEPGNLAARVELIGASLGVAGGGVAADASLGGALAHLDTLRQLAPDPPPEARASYRETEDAARGADPAAARAAFAAFRRYFEVTGPYQADLEALRPPPGRLVGIPRLDFSFMVSLRVQDEEAVLQALRFSDGTDLAGLAVRDDRSGTGPPTAFAVGDVDLDGDEDLFRAADGRGVWLRLELGRFVEASETVVTDPAADAVFGDLDDDGRLDLFVAGATSEVHLQGADGTFDRRVLSAEPGRAAATRVVLADLDLDGDLDAFETAPGPNRFYRNNGDGTFTELADQAGLAGPAGADTRDVAVGDLDGDGDLDLVLAEGPGGIRLLSNLRQGRFEDVTRAVGLAGAGAATAIETGDIDNDGRLDLLVAGPPGTRVFRGTPSGTFEPVPVPESDAAGLVAEDADLIDFDNDGRLDLVVAGRGSGSGGLVLWRNRGAEGFESGSRFLPTVPEHVTRVRSTDYNDDGDPDLLLLDAGGGVRLLRNDGGNANHYIRIAMVGLGEGSRKNNRFGIGARLEVRAGDLLQTLTVTDPTVLVGLDGHLKADVIRVSWPNGVIQDLFFPGTDQDLIERQSLKGSCPLLYVWDGEGFEFVGDVMWKSALGMPLGILGGAGGPSAYAPGHPSQEYRRLPDGVLAPRGGELVVQLTEELWETIYVDDVDLVAVDHPDSIDVFVDERFVPPAPTALDLRRVGQRLRPVSAVDGRGVDHRSALAARDFDYVSNLRPGRYQGIAEPHELILDLGPRAASGDVALYLTGWVFPTDASINTAMSQSEVARARFPALDAIGPGGAWVPIVPDLGIPSGKDKTVVADLSGRFPTADRRVRIRTNLMVYWDEVFFTVGPTRPADGEARVTVLPPTTADLHYRGFSREYRKGGPHGPHWFDYDSVDTASRWRDLTGSYTRYGDVTPLLAAGDDMYVIANAGDEITIRFAAAALPALPDGWRRTFLIYTDGWVKDGDLNTATGDRVEPLPFRGQTRYPYGDEQAYPSDERHRRFVDTYNTRRLGSGRF